MLILPALYLFLASATPTTAEEADNSPPLALIPTTDTMKVPIENFGITPRRLAPLSFKIGSVLYHLTLRLISESGTVKEIDGDNDLFEGSVILFSFCLN